MAKKSNKRVFKQSERDKMKKHYQTIGADPGAPVRYADTAAGKAAYKRAKAGKTSRKAK